MSVIFRKTPISNIFNLTKCAQTAQRNIGSFRRINMRNVHKQYTNYIWIIGCVGTAFVSSYFYKVRAADHIKEKYTREEERFMKLTARERRFIKFASVEYGGQLFMTPKDFLESAVEQEPRPRLKRRTLTAQDVQRYQDSTPALKKGSINLFRSVDSNGIISYTEYLFLLSILTKPESGFRIAFNMFDTDGNQRVDKDEFLVILKVLSGAYKWDTMDLEIRQARSAIIDFDYKENDKQNSIKVSEQPEKTNKTKITIMERIFGKSNVGRDSKKKDNDDKLTEEFRKQRAETDLLKDDNALQRKIKVNTFLLTHFFGKKGKNDLYFDGFYRFMDNLQTEVLELEFMEFAKGQKKISELDFARILLRYTYLDANEYELFLDRLFERVKDDQGITFNEFKDFCRFLNNLDDFAIAMRMYTLADRAISPDEFSRAVKICTGYNFSKHLVETVFAIFDQDGDGLLSYKEFIAIMKDRLHRGFKSVARSEGWDAFKYCIKQEMRNARG